MAFPSTQRSPSSIRSSYQQHKTSAFAIANTDDLSSSSPTYKVAPVASRKRMHLHETSHNRRDFERGEEAKKLVATTTTKVLKDQEGEFDFLRERYEPEQGRHKIRGRPKPRFEEPGVGEPTYEGAKQEASRHRNGEYQGVGHEESTIEDVGHTQGDHEAGDEYGRYHPAALEAMSHPTTIEQPAFERVLDPIPLHLSSLEPPAQPKAVQSPFLQSRVLQPPEPQPPQIQPPENQSDQREYQPRLRASNIRYIDPSAQASSGPSLYTQRFMAKATQTRTQNPLLSLSHARYDLPPRLTHNLAGIGVASMYPWQSTCLLGRGVLTGEQNLVYTAPTGGGKSLVADILLIKRALEGKKAILVLPYVALVQEKLRWLRRALEGVEIPLDQVTGPRWREKRPRQVRVAGFFGGSQARATWAEMDIAVCTIERANTIINTAIAECKIDHLGIVIVDEVHMIDDEHRGYLIELMATKLLSMRGQTQFIAMSATLPNTKLLAEWLDAKFYESKYRPIPIEEYVVREDIIYSIPTSNPATQASSHLHSTQKCFTKAYRQVEASSHPKLKSSMLNSVVALAMETVRAGYGVLIFCNSRQKCQTTAAILSQAMPTGSQVGSAITADRKEVIDNLRLVMTEADAALERLILGGVGYHHAGLTSEQGNVIADAFNRGTLRVITATCSLAAGINLPARRVILQSARMGRDMVGPALLQQMRGRAGRKGKDEVGETFVCCASEDFPLVEQLLETGLPAIQSSLLPEKRGLHRALLEVVAVRLAHHRSAIQDYLECTLLSRTMDPSALYTLADRTLLELVSDGFLKVDDHVYNATKLGQAAVVASLTPEEGLVVYADLEKAMEKFILKSHMHALYLLTPVNVPGLETINWGHFRREVDNLDESGLAVLEICGLNPGLVNRMAITGKTLPETTPTESARARSARRFYAALLLRDLSNEMPIHYVARRYDLPPGAVQKLWQASHGFAAGTVRFCHRLDWDMLARVLECMSERLRAGTRADLLDLARIPFVKSHTARALWEAGWHDVRAVAEADPRDLMPVLARVQPREWRADEQETAMAMATADEARYSVKLRERAVVICEAAQRLCARDDMVLGDEDEDGF